MPALPAHTFGPGDGPLTIGTTSSPITKIDVIIDRTVAGGLNALAAGQTVGLDANYQLSGDTVWHNMGGITPATGVLVTKGVTRTTEEWSPALAAPLPAGTALAVRCTTPVPVVIGGGTSTYTLS